VYHVADDRREISWDGFPEIDPVRKPAGNVSGLGRQCERLAVPKRIYLAPQLGEMVSSAPSLDVPRRGGIKPSRVKLHHEPMISGMSTGFVAPQRLASRV
jgi:hypothetical protein